MDEALGTADITESDLHAGFSGIAPDDRLLSQKMLLGEEAAAVPVDELPALLEALLLAAPEMVTVNELAAAAGFDAKFVEDALDLLAEASGRGWVLQRHGQRVQLATAPQYAEHVRRLLGFEREARLSAAALETLAIVAYQQPITRTAIEAVRGVDSSAVLSTLLTRGLIECETRPDLPGQPFQYWTTPAFLQHFGICSLDELPPLPGSDTTGLSEMLREIVEESDRVEPALEIVGASIESTSTTIELSNP
jgi:segregation and condensation protein B